MAALTRQFAGWLALALLLTRWEPAWGVPQDRVTATNRYQVSGWTTEQGLPQNTVSCVLQTRDGYLWAGTRYGLARFDGVRLRAFVDELGDQDAEARNVRALAEDTHGRLWLCSWEHLLRFEAGRFTAVSLDAAPFAGRIQNLCAAPDGGLWIAKVHGLFHFDDGRIGRAWSVSDFAGKFCGGNGEVERVIPDARGRLWVMTSCSAGAARVWHRLDPRTGAAEALAQIIGVDTEDIGAVMEDRAGRLWAARPGELLRWDGRLNRFPASAAWGNNTVEGLAEDTLGNLWILSRGPRQLHRFNDGRFTTYGRAEGVINSDDLRCLQPDREGNLWVGSGAGGLYRVQPRPLVSLLSGSYSAMDEIYSVAPGRGGRVWLATTYGLVEYNEGRFTVHTNLLGLGDAGSVLRIRPVYEDRSGQVWCGLDHRGLQTLRDGSLEPAPDLVIPEPGRRRVQAILQDRAGSLWVATPQGLWQRDAGGSSRLWTTHDGLADSALCGLAEGPDGSLWVGSERGGIHHLVGQRFERFSTADGLLDPNAWPLRAEPDGTVWVGTPRGLNRIRGREIRSVTVREGLYDNLAYCLLADRQGRYWSFCNRGIWRVKRADLNAVADGRLALLTSVSYGEDDGMVSAEGNGDEQPNAVALPNGELWFPTTRGVVILDPARLQENEVPPGVVIEEVRADDEIVFKDGGYGAELASEVRGPQSERNPKTGNQTWDDPPATGQLTLPIRLPPGRARTLEIRYTATTFLDSDQARFRYRLEGLETPWHEARTRRVALYTNLRPGRYRFHVEACNRHGCWSTVPAEFAFSLAPHFYETWPFYALTGLTFAAGFGGWQFRRALHRARLERWERERAVQEERGRIAKDLHDDLGANLTGMAMQIEVARRTLARPEVAEEHLQGIAKSARAMVTRMREVVWSLNPQCDTLESFCAYVCDYAENFLETAGLRCRLDLPEQLPDRQLFAETRHHLLMVVKEALNNAVRHARASEVRIHLGTEGGQLTLTIADDGRGFLPGNPPADAGADALDPLAAGAASGNGGRGLANMRRRVESLGGRFTLYSEPGRGTRITAHLPLDRQP